MTKHTKKGAGGKRDGSGATKKPETTLINFRIPVSKRAILNERYPKKINSMFNAWVESLTL